MYKNIVFKFLFMNIIEILIRNHLANDLEISVILFVHLKDILLISNLFVNINNRNVSLKNQKERKGKKGNYFINKNVINFKLGS